MMFGSGGVGISPNDERRPGKAILQSYLCVHYTKVEPQRRTDGTHTSAPPRAIVSMILHIKYIGILIHITPLPGCKHSCVRSTVTCTQVEHPTAVAAPCVQYLNTTILTHHILERYTTRTPNPHPPLAPPGTSARLVRRPWLQPHL